MSKTCVSCWFQRGSSTFIGGYITSQGGPLTSSTCIGLNGGPATRNYKDSIGQNFQSGCHTNVGSYPCCGSVTSPSSNLCAAYSKHLKKKS